MGATVELGGVAVPGLLLLSGEFELDLVGIGAVPPLRSGTGTPEGVLEPGEGVVVAIGKGEEVTPT